MNYDTVAAISTAQGEGGIGVIRISGDDALRIADKIFYSVSGKKVTEMKGYTASFGKISENGEDIDEAVALVFKAPHSYTGEDVVELSCHGGLYITKRVLRAVLNAGAVPAQAGEFTKRAFLNGKIDLTEAEAVIDIISAKSRGAARSALCVKEGALRKKIDGVKNDLLSMAAHLSAWADYPEEDIAEVTDDSVIETCDNAIKCFKSLLDSYDCGQAVKKGIDTVIAGRPNVGKSTFFNKIVGRRVSIVEDTPGVTRDRIYGESDWNGRKFRLVDTGGIEPRIDDGLLAHMREQAQLAIDSADCIVMVTELSAGVTPQDQDVASMLMRSGKPVVLAVNKCDKVGEPPMELYDFYSLGLGELIPVSGVHGHGTGDLLDAVCAHLNFEEDEEDTDDRITVAVIGRPNVGKSSLINHILGENRLIVANEAGTTRDAIDTMVENKYGKFIFTDTAGLRKRGKVESGVERYSVLRSLAAVERSRVCVIMIDATVGFTEQDSKVAGYAHEQGKACIIAVNKWDAVEKDSYTMDTMRKKLEEDFSFMSYAPIVFISAKTGQRVDKLFETIHFVDIQNGTRVPTGALNEMLARATAKVQPPSDKGKRLKVFYITQISTRPPTFVCFVNQKALFHFSYQRYLENQIRETFGLTGTPIRMITREHGDGSAKAGKV